MPTIAIVDGMAIMFYPGDRVLPHFHAKFGEYEAQISIATGQVVKGRLPAGKLRKVQQWFNPNQEQLAFFRVELNSGRNRGGFL